MLYPLKIFIAKYINNFINEFWEKKKSFIAIKIKNTNDYIFLISKNILGILISKNLQKNQIF